MSRAFPNYFPNVIQSNPGVNTGNTGNTADPENPLPMDIEEEEEKKTKQAPAVRRVSMITSRRNAMKRDKDM